MLVSAAVGAVVIGGGIVIYNNREAVGDTIEKKYGDAGVKPNY